MEALARYWAGWEFASPHLFWIVSVVGMLFILVPPVRRRHALAFDLVYWQDKMRLRPRALWVLPLLMAVTTLLVAAAAADPQILTRRNVPINGKPVLAVVDVSGSMGYVGKRGEDLAGFEKAAQVFGEVLDGDLDADFGLMLFSSENYIARYFASKKELLSDTLDVTAEVQEISYGTRIADALAHARRYLTENVQARDKAMILISDLQENPSATAQTAEELERIMKTGVKVYIIFMSQDRMSFLNGEPTTIPVQLEGLTTVDMDDSYGIARIRRDLGALASSPIKEETLLSRTSLVPFLLPPIVGLVSLFLVLSESCFKRIP